MGLGDIREGAARRAAALKRYWPFIAAGLVILVITPLVTFAVLRSRAQAEKTQAPPAPLFEDVAIPDESLFLPDEPDFVPEVLPERERRETWTERDAERFWQDPRAGGEEPLKDDLTEAIDRILERVP